MKYGIIYYTGRKNVNLGDVLFALTIKNLYEDMKIAEEKIIRIPYDCLGSYDGEEVLLPINSAMMGYHDGHHITCFADAIKPLFLSLNILSPVLNEDDVAYLRTYAPIGCRDYHTYSVMCDHGIPAYINGCSVLTMNFREHVPRKGKYVLCVDVPPELEPYIPSEYNATRKDFSQIRCMENKENIEEEVYDAYLEYIENAKLIITSRLHCALPMLVAGIPVIFVGKSFNYRFSWLENKIRFYSEDEYSQIDWNPSINHEISAIGDEMRIFLMERIRYSYDYYRYSVRMKNEIFVKQREYFVGHMDATFRTIAKIAQLYNRKLCYLIFGGGQQADMVFDHMTRNYPMSCCAGLLDNRVEGTWHGIEIRKLKDMFPANFDLLIVTVINLDDLLREKLLKACENAQKAVIFTVDGR